MSRTPRHSIPSTPAAVPHLVVTFAALWMLVPTAPPVAAQEICVSSVNDAALAVQNSALPRGDQQKLLTKLTNAKRMLSSGETASAREQLRVARTLLSGNPTKTVPESARSRLRDAIAAVESCLSGAPFFTLAGNRTDPLLLKAERTDGVTVQYFGTKDLEGLTTGVTGIHVTPPSGDATTFHFDNEGRLSFARANNGTTFTFEWNHEGSEALVAGTSADGSAQLNVSVSSASAPAASGAQALSTFVAPQAAAAMSSSTVTVLKCDNPVADAVVNMAVNGNLMTSYDLLGTPVGSGRYRVDIPTTDSSAADAIEKKCSSVATGLGYTCQAFAILGAACPAIAFAASLPGSPLAGAAVLAGCVELAATGTLTCATLGWSPVDGAPSIADGVCKALGAVADRAFNGPVYLQPRATVKGGIIGGEMIEAPGAGPFPDFRIEVPSSVEILSFSTNPADPAPAQGYVATVDITCLPPEASITLSIVGTDGYTDQTTCGGGPTSCSLNVPGADEGVIDTVTVTAPFVTRSITLVF